MHQIRIECLLACALTLCISGNTQAENTAFDQFLKPLFSKNCIKCHGGGKKVKGKVNLKEITSEKQFLAKPKLIKDMIEAIDDRDMPPEDEPQLGDKVRSQLLATLKTMLRESAVAHAGKESGVQRLNRFHYNNSIVDLFALKKDLFALPEKMMLRHTNYLTGPVDKLPEVVNVSCNVLEPRGGFRDLDPFPKDLRAAHGFDNQANQLSISPLLLDSFFQLSQSILASPDFSPQTVGNWARFFKEPDADADLKSEVRQRIQLLMKAAFRAPVEEETLDRYANYAISKVDKGTPFVDGMKAATSAILASPHFLFRYKTDDEKLAEYELASRLSYFLWGSTPDDELLQLAGRGELSKPVTLRKTVDRMIRDPKILRFLDSFPSQWMQLENLFAATPDPGLHRFYHIDPRVPASTQMVLEPLLLFDAVFVENRSVSELISPSFGYRSEFLNTWYESDFKPPPVTEDDLAEANRILSEKRKELQAKLAEKKQAMIAFLAAIPGQVRQRAAHIELPAALARWEAKLDLTKSLGLSNWYRIGPFDAPEFDEAHDKSFLDETNVDLTQAHGDLKWEEMSQFVDGKVHKLHGGNSATYLYRSIHSPAARQVEFSLGTDDGFKLWVNGKVAGEKKVRRGVRPNQDRVQASLIEGENSLLLKVTNADGGTAFFFRALGSVLPVTVMAALKVEAGERSPEQKDVVANHFFSFAPELAGIRNKLNNELKGQRNKLTKEIKQVENLLKVNRPKNMNTLKQVVKRKFEQEIRNKLHARSFRRVESTDPRYGGVITSAAMLTMTSAPKRTQPISRGAWIIEVILNDPPPPPPNDVPPLDEDAGDKNLTIREKFARHRENPDCAGCHSRLDPLGFALENYDVVGRWRDKYPNGREVDASGNLFKKHDFAGAVDFKQSLAKENKRFVKAFTAHLMRFALTRELGPADWLAADSVVQKTESGNHKLKSLIREVILSDSFRRSSTDSSDGIKKQK